MDSQESGRLRRGRPALASFTDVRDLQRDLEAKGVTFASDADESTSGPGSFMVVDPDGNTIIVDQHV